MPGEGGTDWVAWHTDYDDPSSDLSWRRRAVQSAVRCSLDEAGPEPFRIVSACSGDGRDLLEVLATHAAAARTQVRLLELDDRLARRAEDFTQDHGLEGVEVVRSDAGRTDSYAGAVPADLVLLCGVFGNLSDEDVQATVGVARQLCTAGGTVAWTRGRFDRAGFEEVSLDSPKHRSYRVGVHRFLGEPELLVPGRRFFTFKR